MRTRAYQHSLTGSSLPPGETLLRVSDLSLRFGGVKALTDISFNVESGNIHAVIGPNGAGNVFAAELRLRAVQAHRGHSDASSAGQRQT